MFWHIPNFIYRVQGLLQMLPTWASYIIGKCSTNCAITEVPSSFLWHSSWCLRTALWEISYHQTLWPYWIFYSCVSIKLDVDVCVSLYLVLFCVVEAVSPQSPAGFKLKIPFHSYLSSAGVTSVQCHSQLIVNFFYFEKNSQENYKINRLFVYFSLSYEY